MKRLYKAGIIGCGRIACEFPDNHAQAYHDCPDTDLVAVCDTDISKAYKCFKEYMIEGGSVLDDYKGFNLLDLDIISVCTPPETHCQIVCDIAPYVKAIDCEKPIALTLEDADKMIEICDKYKVILQVNHQRRFTHPKMRFSRGIINNGTHAFDLLRQLFGEHDGYISRGLETKYWCFGKQVIEIEYIESPDPIFELDCTHNKEPMLLNGVRYLVACLDEGKQSISSGRVAREDLSLCLRLQQLIEGSTQ